MRILAVLAMLLVASATPMASAQQPDIVQEHWYHTYTTLTIDVNSWADDYPEIVDLTVAGQTELGKNLWVVRISDWSQETKPDGTNKDIVYIDGGHHGNEHLGTELAFLTAEFYIEGWAAGDQEVIDVLTTTELHILVMLNADGNDLDTRWNINQVDLNRNYDHHWNEQDETQPGSGPIRIGQGIEFDYGCVHAAGAIQDLGFEAIIINNNPETVSTDFDTSDRLYFDPLTLESVSEILLREDANGILLQFGGQTAINLALPLSDSLPHLSRMGLELAIEGTSPETVDEASDRERFEVFAERCGLRMPPGATSTTPDGVRQSANELGFPVLVRPSYVLGGRGMEILSNHKQLESYMRDAYISSDRPLLVDKYLGNAVELDVDAVCDGEQVGRQWLARLGRRSSGGRLRWGHDR